MSHPTKIKKPTDRKAWLRLRHKSIGSSEVGSVVGLNTWKSPYELYLEKVSPEPVDREATFQMEYGIMMEDVVAQYYTKMTGNRVRKDNFVRFHPKYPFLSANVDRFITRDRNGQKFPNGDGILEIKTASEHAVGAWKDEIPLYYYSQVQHQFAVTGLQWGAVVVVIGNREFRIVPIVREDAFIAEQVKVCESFWKNNVLKEVAPQWTFQDLDLIYARTGTDAILPGAMIPKIIRAFEVKKAKSIIKKEYDTLKDEIALFMGTSDGLTINGTLTATRKETKPSAKFDEDAFKVAHPEMYEEFVKVPEHGSRRFLLVDKALPLLLQEAERIKQLTA